MMRETSWSGRSEAAAGSSRLPGFGTALRPHRRATIEMIRLAHLGVLTGARFVQERLTDDPLEWLLMPKRLLNGSSCIEACRSVESYRRVLLLHGLSVGLDANPEALAGIPASEFMHPRSLRCPTPARRRPIVDLENDEEPALYTATISAELDGSEVQIFYATIVADAAEVRCRLRQRVGALLEGEACVRLGFDASEPLACALVSEAIGYVLRLVEASPSSDLARGLDIVLEQRFAS